MNTPICLLLLYTINLTFQIQNPKTRFHLSPFTTPSSPNGCGAQAVIAKNFFTACTLQTPDSMYDISGCIQTTMNSYYSGQKWESAILETSSDYSIRVTALNDCLVQQKPYASSQWDYYAWRVQ